MTDFIAAYRDYLTEEKHASANTLSSYIRDLTQFHSWLLSVGVTDMRKVKKETINEYLLHMTHSGKSPATVTRSTASIKSFYAYMMQCGAVKSNPAKSVVAMKVERKYPEILTAKEVELFLEQPQCVDAKGFRDHAMLELLYATGIRVSEQPFITVEAVRSGQAIVSLKGKTRRILLTAALRRELSRYIKERGLKSGSVFVTKSGRPMDRSNILHEMKALCDAAGVDRKKVFPHNLRHLFACLFYQKEKDPIRLADLLGHSNVNTTRIYTCVSGDEQERQIEQLGLVMEAKEKTA